MPWIEQARLALKAVTSSLDLLQENPVHVGTFQKESPRDLVTEYDVYIEKNIIKHLENSPYPILGEETKPFLEIDQGQTFWAVDPIDGTVNFIQQLHYYGIAVGLCHADKDNLFPIIGAFAMPDTKEIFFMKDNNISFWNGKKLGCLDCSLMNAVVAVCFSSIEAVKEKRSLQYQAFGEINDSSRGVMRIGSASAAICYTAASRFQATYGLNIPIWDVVAALAIAKGAGNTLMLQFNSKTMKANFIVGTQSTVNEIHHILKGRNLWQI